MDHLTKLINFFYALMFITISIILQGLWTKFQRNAHVSQQQKSYGINIDNDIKSSTPSMGGVMFILLGFIALFSDFSEDNIIFWLLPIFSGFIGLFDDGLKLLSHSSEGFNSLMKLLVQLIFCTLWVMFASLHGNIRFNFLNTNYYYTSMTLALIASATMINAVNITDGLDGLAAGSFLISLAISLLIFPLNTFNTRNYIKLFSIAAGFLLFNLRPAKTFMGDTGSHFLGAALASLCIMNGNTFTIIPVGFIFIIELLSSAIQIFSIRALHKKIFLMAPLHHHFQKLGLDESSVTLHFWLAHAIGGSILALLFM